MKYIRVPIAVLFVFSSFLCTQISFAQTALIVHENSLFYKSTTGHFVHYNLTTNSVEKKIVTAYKPLFVDQSGKYLILQNDTSLSNRDLDQSFRFYEIKTGAFDYSKDKVVSNLGYVREVNDQHLITISAEQRVLCTSLDSIEKAGSKTISQTAVVSKQSYALSGDFSSNLISSSNDLQYFVCLTSTYKDIQLRKFSEEQYLKPLKGNSSFPVVKFSKDNSTLISGGKKLQLWNVATGKQSGSIHLDGEEIKSMVLSPDGRYLLYRTYESNIALVDLSNKSTKWKISIEEGIRDLSFHPNGTSFILTTKKDAVYQRSVVNGK